MSDAVILAGGIARGAFEGGALAVLLRDVPHLSLRTIVATSSGSLNGAYLASAVRSGRARKAGGELVQLWLERATATGVFDVSLRGLARGEGLSTSAKLLALLRSEIHPSTASEPIELRIIVTGTTGDVVTDEEGCRGTTFERVLRFEGAAFDDLQGLQRMFEGVAASCAIPGAFLAVDVGAERVPCYDGGLVDNSPIKHAINEPGVTRVFVIAPFPSVFAPSPRDRRGFPLAEHMIDILVNERLYRDLKEAREVNRALARLSAALPTASCEAALGALGWAERRPIEIVEIRPSEALQGSAFEGLFSRELREQYVQAGREAAQASIARREP